MEEMLAVGDKTAHEEGNFVVSFFTLVTPFLVELKAKVEDNIATLPVTSSYP